MFNNNKQTISSETLASLMDEALKNVCRQIKVDSHLKDDLLPTLACAGHTDEYTSCKREIEGYVAQSIYDHLRNRRHYKRIKGLSVTVRCCIDLRSRAASTARFIIEAKSYRTFVDMIVDMKLPKL